MQMAVIVIGDSLIIVDMSGGDLHFWPGGDAVVVLMSMIEGYIAHKLVSMVGNTHFFTAYTGNSVTMLMGRGSHAIEVMAMKDFRHVYHLPYKIIPLYTKVYAEIAENLLKKYNIY